MSERVREERVGERWEWQLYTLHSKNWVASGTFFVDRKMVGQTRGRIEEV